MTNQSFNVSRSHRFLEVLLITLVGTLPTLFLGVILRRIFYRITFARLGKDVYIQDGVDFTGTGCIEIGDKAFLFRGVNIDAGKGGSKIRIGNGVAIERGAILGALNFSVLEIGESTFIGSYTTIAGPGNIAIGRNCMIASHCGIFANNHIFDDRSRPIREQGVTCKGITIGNDCWLGHKVTVLDGVSIGTGCVIGAGAVVTKDLLPYSIAVGVPAKVIGQRGAEQLSLSVQPHELISKDNGQSDY